MFSTVCGLFFFTMTLTLFLGGIMLVQSVVIVLLCVPFFTPIYMIVVRCKK